MPTYDYRCPNGHQFEVFQRMSDDPISECAECGARAERQISGGAGFLFKGEGFYITDYRSEEYRRKASAESETPSAVPEGRSEKGDGSTKAKSGAEKGNSSTKTESGSGDGGGTKSGTSDSPSDG